jgi:hypothetical protein
MNHPSKQSAEQDWDIHYSLKYSAICQKVKSHSQNRVFSTDKGHSGTLWTFGMLDARCQPRSLIITFEDRSGNSMFGFNLSYFWPYFLR